MNNDILDKQIIDLLTDLGIKTGNGYDDELVKTFHKGYDHGWYLALDKDNDYIADRLNRKPE